MKRMTLDQLYLGYKELFENKERHILLLSTETGRFYDAALRARFQAMELLELPRGKRPYLAQELEDADDLHDDAVMAARLCMEAHLRMPGLSHEVYAHAIAALNALPSPSDLTRSYASEVFLAQEMKDRLLAFEPSFRQFPMVGGQTAWDLVGVYLKAADQLQKLLADQVAHEVESDTKNANSKRLLMLRGAAQGLLERMRSRLQEEVEMHPDLPRDLVVNVFSYFDAFPTSENSGAASGQG